MGLMAVELAELFSELEGIAIETAPKTTCRENVSHGITSSDLISE